MGLKPNELIISQTTAIVNSQDALMVLTNFGNLIILDTINFAVLN